MDSATVDTRFLASRLQTISAHLRPAVLGNGVSVGHVHCLHVPTLERNRLRAAADHPESLHLPGAARLARRVRRIVPELVFQNPPPAIASDSDEPSANSTSGSEYLLRGDAPDL